MEKTNAEKAKLIGSRIKSRRLQLDITQEELGNILSLNKSSIKRYESGEVKKIKIPVLQAIAKALDVDPSWLALKTDEMGHFETIPQDVLSSSLIPLQKVHYIPVIGRIACGTPILAQENVVDRILLPDHIKADFALQAQGDSMTGAQIDDQDYVYIRSQPEVENGEIAAVLIGEEATLKKVYREDDKLTLLPANPKHDPIMFVKSELKQVKIIGKAVAVLKNLE